MSFSESQLDTDTHLTSNEVLNKLSIGCRATLLVSMDKGGCLYGDDGASKQSVDDHVLLSAAQNLGAEEELNKRHSDHNVDLVHEGTMSILSSSVGGSKRYDARVFSVPIQQVLSLQIVQYLERGGGRGWKVKHIFQ